MFDLRAIRENPDHFRKAWNRRASGLGDKVEKVVCSQRGVGISGGSAWKAYVFHVQARAPKEQLQQDAVEQAQQISRHHEVQTMLRELMCSTVLV